MRLCIQAIDNILQIAPVWDFRGPPFRFKHAKGRDESYAMVPVSSFLQNGLAIALVSTFVTSYILFQGIAAAVRDRSPSLALMVSPYDA